jgi:thiol:disulfide interchange protein DsbC
VKDVMKKTILALLLSGLSVVSYANVEQLKKTVTQQYPELALQNIQATEMKGLYSATIEDQIVYLTEDGQYLLAGTAVRLKDQYNLSKELSLKYNRVDWKSLDLNDAIKVVKGNGSRQLAVFSDPNCSYCKQLETELKKLDNVTIYTFVLPLKPQSVAPAKQVFCESSPAIAWENFIVRGVQPKSTKSCANPVERNLALAQRLGLHGTPAIIFSNGSKVMGALPAAEIEKIWKTLGL